VTDVTLGNGHDDSQMTLSLTSVLNSLARVQQHCRLHRDTCAGICDKDEHIRGSSMKAAWRNSSSAPIATTVAITANVIGPAVPIHSRR
jgi:hypothetical protein